MDQKPLFYRKSAFKYIFIVGSSRVGKTSLASYLAKEQCFEFLDEPWLPMFLPVLLRTRQLSKEAGLAMLNSYLDELGNNILLYRRGNFRFRDASSIWKFKSIKMVVKRLVQLNSRSDAIEYAKKNHTRILITLPETTPFIDDFLNLSPDFLVIYMTRNQEDVVKEYLGRQWLSDDQLIQPKNNQPYRIFILNEKKYYLPWWIDEKDAENFIGLDDRARAEFSYLFFNNEAILALQRLEPDNEKRVLKVDFDTFIKRPDTIREKLYGIIDQITK
ncbi:MAG: hypothetical protein AB7D28_04090 [Candidatus Berkiella sp.]